MEAQEKLVEQFEANRAMLRGMAYRMLGSLSEAEDAVQETWLHLTRPTTNFDGIQNLRGWLMTVQARICLDMLRLREVRQEEPLGLRLPDPVVSREGQLDPEHEVLLGEAVGLALQVVLETLVPAERVAFVLHDVFSISFNEIAEVVGRSPAATRQLASRARRRVQVNKALAADDLTVQREVVQAFLAASHQGDFNQLLNVLDPNIVLRADLGGRAGLRTIHGAKAVAEQAFTFAGLAQFAQPALVNGVPGFVATRLGQPFSVMGFTARGGRIVEIFVFADPARLRQLNLDAFYS